jgi:hypothetical protein
MKNLIKQLMNELEYSNAEDAEDMLEMAEYFDSLDAEDFEDMDDAEYAEYEDFLEMLEDAEHAARTKKRVRRPAGKRAVRRKPLLGRKKKHMTTLRGRTKLAAVGGGGNYARPGAASKSSPQYGSKGYINQMMTTSKGDLNITVTRATANIASPLPYILFGLNGFNSSYISTLRDYLPSGTTVAATVDAATGDVLLTFTSGANVDIVRLSLTGSLISYSEFLQSMNTNFFKTRYIRQEYPNTSTLLTAVSQPINFGLLSALGMKNANNLLPRSRRLNDDYQTFIINLFLAEQKVTSDFSFVQNIIAVADYTIAWDVFMSDRVNLNNM